MEEGQEALLFTKLPLPARTPLIQRKEVNGKDKKKTVRENARLCEWLLVSNGTTLQGNHCIQMAWLKIKPESCPVQQGDSS